MTGVAAAAETVARAETTSLRTIPIISAVLAAALLTGCGGSGGSTEKTYSIGPTAECLHEQGERAVRHQNDPLALRLDWAFLRFHPTIDDAKAFDVSALNTNFGGYEYHQKRYGNVSLVWATGGRRDLTGPPSDEVETVERCLRA